MGWYDSRVVNGLITEFKFALMNKYLTVIFLKFVLSVSIHDHVVTKFLLGGLHSFLLFLVPLNIQIYLHCMVNMLGSIIYQRDDAEIMQRISPH